MRAAIGFGLALLAGTGLSAQNRSGFVTPPNVTRAPGSVVYPGSSSALPGVQRTVGSVVHPGGGTPQIGVPGLRWQGVPGAYRPYQRNTSFGYGYAYPVAVPVYVGGYYDNMQPQAPMYQQQQQPPNVIVVYPPAPAYSSTPAYIYQPPAQSNTMEPPPADTQARTEVQGEATHYLLAFKDHSIYSAVAYWVEGDTLHYFTSGNTHNQVSLSLVDRDLTKRLNEGSGLEVKLPPAR